MSKAVPAETIQTAQNSPEDIRYILEKINQTMVGREAEAEMFKKQFDRVLWGGMGLNIVCGKPGIGKSFFMENAAGSLVGGGVYIHGKFRQYDKKPLIAFSEIIEHTVRHILTLPTEALKNIKNELSRKIGKDIGIILSICPYTAILFESHKAVGTDNFEQIKYRVRKAIYQFLTTVSTTLFPLVIFIDDLQWADDLSINIIEILCQDYEILNLHLVLSWRENGVFLNPAKLRSGDDIRIELGGLTEENIDRYLRLVFEQDMKNAHYLVRMLHGLTRGNPFNISRILRMLLAENVISRSAPDRQWTFWNEKMKDLHLPADIELLLTRQMDGLATEDRKLLNLAACCGEVTSSLLQALTGEDTEILNARLDALCQNALLVKNVSEVAASYGFAHDIVLKIVYNRLTEDEKSQIHLSAAIALKEQKSNPLGIATHLVAADMNTLLQYKTGEWTDILFEAGALAKQGAAVEQTLEIFERCAALLPEGSPLEFDVRLELAECRYICERKDDIERDFETLLAEYPEAEKQLRVKRKYINFFAVNGEFEKVLDVGGQILTHLNFSFREADIIPDLIISRLILTDGKISRLENAPGITDERILLILETITNILPAANRISDKMSAALALKMTILSARHGNSDYAPVAYATYAYVLHHILGDYKKGKRLEDIALALVGRCESLASRFVSLCILGSLTHHWTHPLTGTLGILEQAVSESEKESSNFYGAYAAALAVITKYMLGAPLGELRVYIDSLNKNIRVKHYLRESICNVYEGHIRWLAEGTVPKEQKASDYKKLYANIIKLNSDMIAIQRFYLEGSIQKAYLLAQETEPEAALRKGFLLNVEFMLYAALTRLAIHNSLSAGKKPHNKGRIKKHLRELQSAVAIYPDNHRARYLLAQAEYDAVFTPEKANGKLYTEAMDFAAKQSNLPLEALANLLAAKFHSGDTKLSRFYSLEAASLYQSWGADYIAGLIAGNMAATGEAAATSEQPDTRNAQTAAPVHPPPDILFHLDKIEKLSEDEGYLYLLSLLLRQEDADYCAVFFEKSDEMFLKYDIRRGGKAHTHNEPVNISHITSLPHKIIRYVARTQTEIISDGKTAAGIFANDSYLKEKGSLSLTCLPVKYSGVLIGIIYIEKEGGSGISAYLPTFIKGVLPSLVAKQTVIREVNLPDVLNPQNENALFTERELEVLKNLSQGMSNQQISAELNITLSTVKTHLRSIYTKLETDNRVKAVLKAKELKIIPS